MIGLIQRVNYARVKVDDRIVGEIDAGFLLLLGIEKDDTAEIAEKLANKISKLRVFNDLEGKMNLNLLQINGKLLIVSQFTLAADTRKGNRPGFSSAADPTLSKSLYLQFIQHCQNLGIVCESGEFGADMKVTLENDGPVTFHLKVN